MIDTALDTSDQVPLPDAVARLTEHDETIGLVRAEQIWRALTGWSPDDDAEAYEAFASALTGELGVELAVRPGAWTFDVRSAAAQTLLCSATLSGILIAAGYDQIPGYVLPTIVPIVFNLKAARLSRRDDLLLAEVRLATADDGQTRDVEALWAKLPKKTRRVVSKFEFADFVDRLVSAGAADRADEDRVRVRRHNKRVWLRISPE